MPNRHELLESGSLTPAIEWFSEQIPGGFFIYRADDSMEILYINNAVLNIFGCETIEEFKKLTGYTFKGLVHPEDFEATQRSIDMQISRSNNNEKNDYAEYRIIRKDGNIRWIEDYGHFAQLPGYGDVFYVFIGDITEKHLAEEENTRRETVYSGLKDQYRKDAKNSLSAMRINLTKDMIEASGGTDPYPVDVVGKTRKDSISARLENLPVEGDREKFLECFETEKLLELFYQGKPAASFVAYCKRASGKQCFVRFSRAVALNPSTGDLILFGSDDEYNDEKVSEILNTKVLARQYDMVTYIVDNNYSVVIGDADNIGKGNIFPKKRSGIYMDYIREQVIPAASKTAHLPDEMEKAFSPETIEKQLEHNDSYTIDLTCMIDGETYNKRFTYYVVDKTAKFFLLLKSDVTDVLQREHDRNAILADALKNAEQANAAKTSFLSNMSHEIRTPMNAIIGLNSIALKDPNLSPATRDNLVKIGQSARHLLGIINDILDMSRIESGRMTLRKEEFSITHILQQINTLIQSQCDDKNLTYRCQIGKGIGEWYFGDDMKLKQVLINILSNAIKFTEPGGNVDFNIEKTAEYEGSTTFRFTIKDTGIGMDPEFIPKIFDTFTQENSGRSNRYGSTGLGMAITKSIVELMNGYITVRSQKGKGTEFVVTITLKNCDSLSDTDMIAPGSLKVLVVDDDPIALEQSKSVLDEVGISADVCHSGEEALQAMEIQHAKHSAYNLILLDRKMPVLDGFDVTREIRRKFGYEPTIIILTAYSWDDIINEAMTTGVDGFMPKPLFANNVLSEISYVITRRSNKARIKKKKAQLAGRRILLAEDMLINAAIMEELLSTKDIKVEHAENGKLAMEMFAEKPPFYYDAILMDVRMPVMDGLQSAQAIRDLVRPDSAYIPIIALTANAFDEDVQLSLQVGMNAHLSKPVEPDSLMETLGELIYEFDLRKPNA